MSAPRTDIERQKRRHFAPLAGVALAVAFGLGMFVLWLFDVLESENSRDMTEPAQQEENATAADGPGASQANDGGRAPDE